MVGVETNHTLEILARPRPLARASTASVISAFVIRLPSGQLVASDFALTKLDQRASKDALGGSAARIDAHRAAELE